MALKDSFTAIRYHGPNDPYHYTIDNRPLEDLKTGLDFLADTLDAGFSTIDLTVTGNTILGNASGDTLTINCGTWTLGNNFIATRAAGTLIAGASVLMRCNTTFTGDVGGTSSPTSLLVSMSHQGANAFDVSQGVTFSFSHGGSSTIAYGVAHVLNPTVSSTGNATTYIASQAAFTLSNSGSITTAYGYYTPAHTFNSTGSIGTYYPFRVSNVGNALVTTVVGFSVVDQTGSTTMRGLQSSLSAGAGKHNLYIDGTADNSFAGPIYPAQDTKAIQTTSALYAGTGVPNNANGNNGDYYFRGDTPGTVNQRLYVKSAGAWVGIA